MGNIGFYYEGAREENENSCFNGGLDSLLNSFNNNMRDFLEYAIIGAEKTIATYEATTGVDKLKLRNEVDAQMLLIGAYRAIIEKWNTIIDTAAIGSHRTTDPEVKEIKQWTYDWRNAMYDLCMRHQGASEFEVHTSLDWMGIFDKMYGDTLRQITEKHNKIINQQTRQTSSDHEQ